MREFLSSSLFSRLPAFSLAALVLLAAPACKRSSDPAADKVKAPEPPKVARVEVQAAVKHTFSGRLPITGELKPVQEVTLKSRVAGNVVVLNFDPKGTTGPRPPKDEMREALLELVYGRGPSALTLNVVVPDGRQSFFAGLEAELEAARPTTGVTVQFITPQQMNSCSVSVGLPGPGGGGTTFVNTCEPYAAPARPAGEAVAWYVGLFDLWAFESGGTTFDLSPYIYSLVNASDLLYIDTTGLSRVQFDPGVVSATPQQARFSVRSFEFEVGDQRTLIGARFVDAQGIPEPATALLALLAAGALAASRRRAASPG